ncbi:MAG: metallophosphoesterase family protein [Clostridiales bacterium]|nr:metallophosphoesterase family protein [Clostridiales bacterium]
MLLWTLAPMVLLLLLGWYLYAFAMRGLVLVIQNKKTARIVALIVSGIITLAAMIAWAFANVFVIIVLHLYAFLALVDLASLIIRKICKREPKVWKIIHRTAAIPLAVTIALMTYGSVNIRNVHEVEYTVITEKSIRTEGYEIALLADIHYGLLDNGETLHNIAERIEERGVDLVILCGDIVDEKSSREGVTEVFELFGNVKSTLGTYYVYGNHDRARYSSSADFDEAYLKEAIEKSGVTLLDDKAVTLTDDLILLGRNDKSIDHAELDELMQGLDTSKFLLVADHQPYEYEKKAETGIDLVLSGHTHSGQIFPFGLFDRLFKGNDLSYGYEQVGSMQAIVTSGVTGWGFPIRTEGQSEYVFITVKGK